MDENWQILVDVLIKSEKTILGLMLIVLLCCFILFYPLPSINSLKNKKDGCNEPLIDKWSDIRDYTLDDYFEPVK